ncbi:MAG: anaerobic ribonucleoside-triphosphate reductase activating protein [Muribaculaceae bacterium]|nr:anaerobic ribonucleoside-triphosphate reductase activating protein [Muribaculaceae bacterium]
MKPLRVVDVVEGTSVDGPGLRTSIYLAGCAHRCPGCHNPSTWDFKAGRDNSVDELLEIIDRNGYNVTLSGGDPIYQAETLLPLVRAVRSRGLSVWCYTGFSFEELLAQDAPNGARELLREMDVLVDGPFVESLRDTSLMFRGSSNQRIIDLPASLSEGLAVLHTLHDGPPLPKF